MAGKQDRGVRNKVKQIILIDGHPDYLYENKTHISHTIIVKGKVFNMGKINTDFINSIKDIPGIEVTSKNIVSKKVKGIDGFKGLKLRNLPDSTTIEMSAKTERDLAYKINDLRSNLLENGINSVERCSWVCVIDKAKDENKTSKNEILKDVSSSFVTHNKKIDDNDESKEDNNDNENEPMTKERKTKELRKMVDRLNLKT